MADFDEKDFDETDFDEEELDNVIELTDEDGETVQYEFLDLITYEDNDYVVLLPVDEDSDEVVILQVEASDDEDSDNYVSVESEEILTAVFDIFKEKFKDDFDFADED